MIVEINKTTVIKEADIQSKQKDNSISKDQKEKRFKLK